MQGCDVSTTAAAADWIFLPPCCMMVNVRFFFGQERQDNSRHTPRISMVSTVLAARSDTKARTLAAICRVGSSSPKIQTLLCEHAFCLYLHPSHKAQELRQQNPGLMQQVSVHDQRDHAQPCATLQSTLTVPSANSYRILPVCP
jgi:hypothetical protein